VGPAGRFKPDERRRLKKLTFKLKFLREELREHQDQHDFFRLEVINVLNELRKYISDEKSTDSTDTKESAPTSLAKYDFERNNLESNSSRDDEASCANIDYSDDPELRKMRMLYRKIATLTHPDKLQHMDTLDESEIEDRIQIYKQASEALAQREMDVLVELAIYLGVDVELPISVKIKRIEDQAERINGRIKEIEESVEWLWGIHFDNDIIRVRIISAVCQHAGCNVPDASTIMTFLNDFDKRQKKKHQRKRKVGERPKKVKR
jgi:hypothetical protein|tara:strand:+ start:3514 stop:4305 length:792 start_codon:yes stop_codon:yes gene_type:complete